MPYALFTYSEAFPAAARRERRPLRRPRRLQARPPYPRRHPISSAAQTAAPAGSGVPVAADQPARAQAPAPSAPSPAAPTPHADLPASVSVSKLHTEGKHYTLDAKVPAVISKGGGGDLEITLFAKDGYHVNDKFPYKFTPPVSLPSSSPFSDAEITRKNATFTKTEARFKAPFTATEIGEGKIGRAPSRSPFAPRRNVSSKTCSSRYRSTCNERARCGPRTLRRRSVAASPSAHPSRGRRARRSLRPLR